MSMRLLNKVALITASTDGIAFAVAERFLKEGSKVMICSRKADNVDHALNKLRQKFDERNFHGMVCHVGIEEDRRKLISDTVNEFGKIDILVSNAGLNIHRAPALECTEAVWDKMMDINLKSTFFLVKEVSSNMNKNGSIIINSSISAYKTMQILGIYSIAKTALLGMVKVLSLELARTQGIRVNGIAPGLIDTKFSKVLHGNPEHCEDAMNLTHLDRIGTPEEIAGVVFFLASDDASYITGETIVAAGGYFSRL